MVIFSPFGGYRQSIIGREQEKKALKRESVYGQMFTLWVIAKRMIGTCNLQVKAIRVW